MKLMVGSSPALTFTWEVCLAFTCGQTSHLHLKRLLALRPLAQPLLSLHKLQSGPSLLQHHNTQLQHRSIKRDWINMKANRLIVGLDYGTTYTGKLPSLII